MLTFRLEAALHLETYAWRVKTIYRQTKKNNEVAVLILLSAGESYAQKTNKKKIAFGKVVRTHFQ